MSRPTLAGAGASLLFYSRAYRLRTERWYYVESDADRQARFWRLDD